MKAHDAAKYLMREAESLRVKNLSLSKYFEELSKELSHVPQIIIGQRSGKLLEEIMWPDHAKASACFRTDATGVKLPFPALWLEIDAVQGIVKGMLVKQLKDNLILGIAFESGAEDIWNVYRCEFLITPGTISGRVRGDIEGIFPDRPELRHILEIYSLESIVPLPLSEYDSIEEIQGIFSAMEFHFWSLCLFLNALKLPDYELSFLKPSQYEFHKKNYH